MHLTILVCAFDKCHFVLGEKIYMCDYPRRSNMEIENVGNPLEVVAAD